jgi:plasmid replication initiation protein
MRYEKNRKTRDGANKNSEPVLKKHVGLIHCENKLSFLQRKICNVLLFHALDGIEIKDIHQIPLNQLCSLIGYRSNDINLIKKSIKSLISTVMEWNLLEDNKFLNEANFSKDAISWNASALLAGASIERGIISYSYSPQIKTVLSSLEIYGRINLFVQSKFNSSYSLVLYENCVRFKNIAKTAWFRLDLFRALMGLVGKKYESFKELKRNVITVAVNEINQKSDITVEPEYKKAGRAIAAIRFLISENENYKPTFKRVAKLTDHNVSPELNQSSLLEILASEFGIQEKQAKELLLNYIPSYIAEKISLVKKSKKAENPAAYLISALKNDYQENKKTSGEKKENRGIESTYLRETSEASQVRSLKRKYTKYKFDQYIKYFSEKNILDIVKNKFIADVLSKNQIIGELYKKKDIYSPPAMIEFIDYANQHYSNHNISFLDFEEYLTEEEVA